jgi:hypothetical protein
MKEECPFCYGASQNVEGDFCDNCGIPSVEYQEKVYKEMIDNGEIQY